MENMGRSSERKSEGAMGLRLQHSPASCSSALVVTLAVSGNSKSNGLGNTITLFISQYVKYLSDLRSVITAIARFQEQQNIN